MKIAAQLKALGLPAFEGRQHSGIDVSIRLSGSLFLEIEIARLIAVHRIPATLPRLLSNLRGVTFVFCRIQEYIQADDGRGWENQAIFWRII